MGARRPVARLRVRPERREQHLPLRPGRATSVYQLTDLYTGVQGITPLSPVLSGRATPTGSPSCTTRTASYDVYTLDNPRALEAAAVAAGRARGAGGWPRRRGHARRPPGRRPGSRPDPQVGEGGSIYRTHAGLPRAADPVPAPDTASARAGRSSIGAAARLGQLRAARHQRLHDPAYHAQFHAGLRGPAEIGYARDNFGRASSAAAPSR